MTDWEFHRHETQTLKYVPGCIFVEIRSARLAVPARSFDPMRRPMRPFYSPPVGNNWERLQHAPEQVRKPHSKRQVGVAGRLMLCRNGGCKGQQRNVGAPSRVSARFSCNICRNMVRQRSIATEARDQA